jgi:hypothetical protein
MIAILLGKHNMRMQLKKNMRMQLFECKRMKFIIIC